MLQPFLVPSYMPFDIPQPHTTESSSVIKNCESGDVSTAGRRRSVEDELRASGITQQSWPVTRLWYDNQVMIYQIEEHDIP